MDEPRVENAHAFDELKDVSMLGSTVTALCCCADDCVDGGVVRRCGQMMYRYVKWGG